MNLRYYYRLWSAIANFLNAQLDNCQKFKGIVASLMTLLFAVRLGQTWKDNSIKMTNDCSVCQS